MDREGVVIILDYILRLIMSYMYLCLMSTLSMNRTTELASSKSQHTQKFIKLFGMFWFQFSKVCLPAKREEKK